MRMTAIHAQTERKRQDRSVRCAEKHQRRARTRRLRSDPPCSSSLRNRRHRLGRKMLVQRAKLGDLHVSQHATWGMSVDGVDAEAILRGEDRSWIERELLNQEKLSLYTAEPDFGLKPEPTKTLNRFALQLNDAATKHERKLYFYSKGSVPKETNTHPAVADPTALVFDWRIDATVQWLREFDALCATPYVDKIRGFFDKPKFQSLLLNISATELELAYWWDAKEKGYAESYKLPYTAGTSLAAQAADYSFTANARDLALVFATLPSLPITSPHVSIQGNANVLRVSYTTDLAEYETYIPAADVAGNRATSRPRCHRISKGMPLMPNRCDTAP